MGGANAVSLGMEVLACVKDNAYSPATVTAWVRGADKVQELKKSKQVVGVGIDGALLLHLHTGQRVWVDIDNVRRYSPLHRRIGVAHSLGTLNGHVSEQVSVSQQQSGLRRTATLEPHHWWGLDLQSSPLQAKPPGTWTFQGELEEPGMPGSALTSLQSVSGGHAFVGVIHREHGLQQRVAGIRSLPVAGFDLRECLSYGTITPVHRLLFLSNAERTTAVNAMGDGVWPVAGFSAWTVEMLVYPSTNSSEEGETRHQVLFGNLASTGPDSCPLLKGQLEVGLLNDFLYVRRNMLVSFQTPEFLFTDEDFELRYHALDPACKKQGKNWVGLFAVGAAASEHGGRWLRASPNGKQKWNKSKMPKPKELSTGGDWYEFRYYRVTAKAKEKGSGPEVGECLGVSTPILIRKMEDVSLPVASIPLPPWALGDDALPCQSKPSNDALSFNTSPLPPQQWSHIAATFDGLQLRLLVDAEVLAIHHVSTPIAHVPEGQRGNHPWLLGAGWSSCKLARGFSGVIAETRVWSRALSLSDLVAVRIGGVRGWEEGLEGYWPLGDVPGATPGGAGGAGGGILGGVVVDLSANQQHGWFLYGSSVANTNVLSSDSVGALARAMRDKAVEFVAEGSRAGPKAGTMVPPSPACCGWRNGVPGVGQTARCQPKQQPTGRSSLASRLGMASSMPTSTSSGILLGGCATFNGIMPCLWSQEDHARWAKEVEVQGWAGDRAAMLKRSLELSTGGSLWVAQPISIDTGLDIKVEFSNIGRGLQLCVVLHNPALPWSVTALDCAPRPPAVPAVHRPKDKDSDSLPSISYEKHRAIPLSASRMPPRSVCVCLAKMHVDTPVYELRVFARDGAAGPYCLGTCNSWKHERAIHLFIFIFLLSSRGSAGCRAGACSAEGPIL